MQTHDYALASADQMRACDAYAIQTLGIAGAVLMESAGRGAVPHLLELIQRRVAGPVHSIHVMVFCGGGNNGGDGYVIARELLRRGFRVHVILLSKRSALRGESAQNCKILEQMIHELGTVGDGQILAWGDLLNSGSSIEALLARIGTPHVVVDALLGTGLTHDVRSPYRDVIEWINGLNVPVFSVDLPSGLHADTGQPLPIAIRADMTATFALAKIGQCLPPGSSFCGDLRVVDIGIPPRVKEVCGVRAVALHNTWVSKHLPPRPKNGHKGTFGHSVILGGSFGKAGALVLSTRAALRAGAGLVTAVGSPDAQRALNASQPEAMTELLETWYDAAHSQKDLQRLLAKRDAVAIGPGLGTGTQAQDLLYSLLSCVDRPLVLDADALNMIATHPQHARLLAETTARIPVVLTPHPGELARLVGYEVRDVVRDLRNTAQHVASNTGCIVVAKSSTTLILHPDERLAVSTTGNDGMASGGSGDVLTGMITSFLGQGVDPWDATCAAVFLHGRAGDIASQALGRHTLLAGDLLLYLKDAFASCSQSNSPKNL